MSKFKISRKYQLVPFLIGLLFLQMMGFIFIDVHNTGIESHPDLNPKNAGTLERNLYPITLSQINAPDFWTALDNRHVDNMRIAYFDGSEWILVPFQLDEKGYVRTIKYEIGFQATVQGLGVSSVDLTNYGRYKAIKRYLGKDLDAQQGYTYKELTKFECETEFWGSINAEDWSNDPGGAPPTSPTQEAGDLSQNPHCIDYDDELFFYAYNGDQVAPSNWWNSVDYPYRYEIAINDPIDNGEAWMYIYYNLDDTIQVNTDHHFIPSNGPYTGIDYVNWDVSTLTAIGQNYDKSYEANNVDLSSLRINSMPLAEEVEKQFISMGLHAKLVETVQLFDTTGHNEIWREGTWLGNNYNEMRSFIGYGLTMDLDLPGAGDYVPGQDADYRNGHDYDGYFGQSHGNVNDGRKTAPFVGEVIKADSADHDGDSSEIVPFARGVYDDSNVNGEAAIDGPCRVIINQYKVQIAGLDVGDKLDWEELYLIENKESWFTANKMGDFETQISLDMSIDTDMDLTVEAFVHFAYIAGQKFQPEFISNSDSYVMFGQAPQGESGLPTLPKCYDGTGKSWPLICTPDGSQGSDEYTIGGGPVEGHYNNNPINPSRDENPLSDWAYMHSSSGGALMYIPYQETATMFTDNGFTSAYWADGATTEFSVYGNNANTNGATQPYERMISFGDFDGGSESATDINCKTEYARMKMPLRNYLTFTYQEAPVDSQPDIDFIADKTSVDVGEIVTFSSSGSLGDEPSTYLWNFGDGTTSTSANPTHVYATAGIYTVILTVTDSDGDDDVETKKDYIEVIEDLVPDIDFNADVTSIFEGESVSFTSSGTLGNTPSTYLWNFGDGTTSTSVNPTYVYATAGTYTVTLTVTDSDGDDDVETKTNYIEVIEDLIPDIDFSADVTSIFEGESVSFTSSGTLGNTPSIYLWNFGDGTTSTSANPTHVYATAGTYTVTLTVTDSDGDDDVETKTNFIEVIGDFVPDIDFSADVTSIFEGESVSFTSSGTLGNTPSTYLWNFGDGTTSTSANPTHVYSTAGTYTVILTVTDSDGDDDVETKTNYIEVIEDLVPNIDFSADVTSIFEGESVSFTSSGTLGNAPSTYLWNFGDGTTSTSANPTHVYATAGTYTVILTVTDSDGDDDVETKTDYIEVIEDLVPDIDFNADVTSIFEGESVSFTSSGTLGNTPSTYLWNFGDGTTSTSANPTHVYATAGTYTVILTVTDSDGDDDVETKTDYIEVIEDLVPDIDFSADVTSIFEGESVSFTSSGTLGNTPSTYLWNFGDGTTSTSANPTHVYATAGTYTVTLTVTDSDGDDDVETKTDYIEVIEDLVPDIDFSADVTSIFEGESVSFTSSGTLGNTPSTYLWNFGDGTTSTSANPTHVYATAGTYTVTLTVTDSDGDDDVETKTNYIEVIENLIPDIDFSADDTSILTGDLVSFTSSGTLGNAPSTYLWNFGDGTTSTSANPTHVYATAGTYTVTLTVTDSDGDDDVETKTNYIEVIEDLVPDIDFSADVTSIFEGESVLFTSSGTLGNTPSTYFWNFGDGTTSTSANPTHVYATAGTYTVTLTVTDSDGDDDVETKTGYIEVIGDSIPDIDFSADVTSIFEGESVSFTSFGNLGNTPSTYLWNFGDGTTSTSANPTHVYATAGTYTVILTVTDSDGDDDVEIKTNYIEVIEDLIPDIDFSADVTSIFEGESVSFTSSGTLGNTPSTYLWNFGDGTTSTSANPTHVYATAGTYTVTLTVTDNDGDDDVEIKTGYIEVIGDLVPDIDFSADVTSIFEGESVLFTSSGTLGNTPSTYLWNFGDGTTSTSVNPTHVYATAGTYTVTLTVTDSDGDDDVETKTNYIEVIEDLIPDIDFSADVTSIFEGESVLFTSSGTLGNTPSTYLWNFGDGTTSTSANPTHVYATAGTYTVTLTVTDNDGDDDVETKTGYIEVIGDLVPDIDFSADVTSIFEGESVLFTSSGTLGNTPSTYLWNFGDGTTSTSANPTHVYATAGTYTVTLTVTDSDGDDDVETKTNYIEVIEDLIPDIDFSADVTSIFEGESVSFTSSGTLGNTPSTYLWNFGDGTTSTSANPTHVYATAGTYTVTLTVTDSDGDDDVETKTNYIEVIGDLVPDIDFSADVTSIFEGESVLFTSSGTLGNAPSTYLWNFGDGTTSTSANPTHVYATAGTYTVTLTVTDSDGDDDVETKTNYIEVIEDLIPDIDFSADVTSIFEGESVSFTSSGTLGNTPSTYLWNFGDGTTSTSANPTHVYATAGTYTVTLTVTDSDGDDDVETKTNFIEVIEDLIPDIDFSVDVTSIFEGESVSFTSSGTLGNTPSTYLWNFGDGTTSTSANPTHVYTTAGTYTVTLTVTDSDGDDDVETKTGYIEVIGDLVPDIDFSADVTSIFESESISFTSSGTLGNTPSTYLWNFGDGTTSTSANPTHVYATAGTYTVTLTVTDSDGDDDVETKTNFIEVIEDLIPDIDFSADVTSIFEGESVSFTSSGTLGNTPSTYLWNFGDGTTSNSANPTHVYATAGTYTVTLTVTDSDGDEDIESKVDFIVVNDHDAPTKVTGLYVRKALYETGIYLEWDANPEPNIDHYNIYREGILITTTNETSYYDFNDTYGEDLTLFTYEVSAVNNFGQEGLKSDPASASEYVPPGAYLEDFIIVVLSLLGIGGLFSLVGFVGTRKR